MSSRNKLLFLNLVFFALGVSMLSLGLWARYGTNFATLWNSLDISKIIDARSINGASLLLVLSGGASLVISFVGLYGSLRKNRCFLIAYGILVAMVLIVEICSSGAIVSYKGLALKNLEQGLNKTVDAINKDNDPVANEVMKSLQTVFKCCGCYGPEDYKVHNQTSCVDTSDIAGRYYPNGCYKTILGFFQHYSSVLLGVALTITFLQIICLIFSVRLYHQLGVNYEEI